MALPTQNPFWVATQKAESHNPPVPVPSYVPIPPAVKQRRKKKTKETASE